MDLEGEVVAMEGEDSKNVLSEMGRYLYIFMLIVKNKPLFTESNNFLILYSTGYSS